MTQAEKEAAKAAKEAEKEAAKAALPAENGSNRQARFNAVVEAYAKRNPLKYAAKKEAGQFDKIPDDFL